MSLGGAGSRPSLRAMGAPRLVSARRGVSVPYSRILWKGRIVSFLRPRASPDRGRRATLYYLVVPKGRNRPKYRRFFLTVRAPIRRDALRGGAPRPMSAAPPDSPR